MKLISHLFSLPTLSTPPPPKKRRKKKEEIIKCDCKSARSQGNPPFFARWSAMPPARGSSGPTTTSITPCSWHHADTASKSLTLTSEKKHVMTQYPVWVMAQKTVTKSVQPQSPWHRHLKKKHVMTQYPVWKSWPKDSDKLVQPQSPWHQRLKKAHHDPVSCVKVLTKRHY